ncbi:IclR family transcriptional regulator [Bordetella bronchiseptica]|nr:IclR family transcriptional regulator [Bordetella bronchiseptica]KDC65129.1 transcriptional regulator, IclR family, C-terminal domain protein [Bordetella bronchiseptica MBORD624]KDD16548.1 transcriptional regulator, IclR family, C-terminal domain protein [Bordetella bronchiseptica MBORD731]KDD64774.1 transcriptional regulator, IclR family, C-terminal domain protein [Bordetella bronchiseptica SO10328]QBS68429.1 IclR family transcriptional regulator [Bordetella bronchiseptica]
MNPMTATMKGAQAVSRALSLLRHISHGHPHGIGIAELAIAAQLDRTTAYRLASSLVEFGLVERDPARNYRLGVEAMQLGLAAMRSAPVVERLRPIMRRLARRTEDTVFLVVRNGDYGHCLHSEEGSYPVKALVLQVGGMRVLGIGSAGSTLLANLPDDEIAALYQRHQDEFDPRGLSLGKLRRLVQQTRRRGYADTADLVADGVSGVGMRFEFASGSQAALSVAAIRSRMPPERKAWIAQLIAEELQLGDFIPSYLQGVSI